jgi:NAD(P)-dependent dehydrogenase (short-subunit alcohol dehydrogenase family)
MSTIAVAGAGGSLGPAVVEALLEDGHEVSAPGREDVDLLDPFAAEAWAGSLARVDGLVHMVGGWRGGARIDDAPDEDAEWLHDRLVRTLQHVSRVFLPALRESGGRFVLVSSAAALRPDPKSAAYAASKAYAEAWTLAMARDLGEFGGTANIVAVLAIGDDKPSFTPAADIGAAIAFVLGEHGSRMNGQRLALHA